MSVHFDHRGFDTTGPARAQRRSKVESPGDFVCYIGDLPDLMPNGLPLGGGRFIPWDETKPGRYVVKNGVGGDVAFLRVSTDSQFDSLQTQMEMAVHEAKRRGIRIAAVYVDPAISASRIPIERRPGARSLLADIHRKTVRSVIAYKRDRLARNLREFMDLYGLCLNTNTELVYTCPGEAPSGTGAYGAFGEAIFAALAQLETDVTRMRVIDSMISRVNNGEYIGGNLPYGMMWDAEGGRIVPDPGEAQVVREMFRLAAEEMLGAMRIAMRLNKTHPNSRRGKPWNAIMVLRVLNNRSYCGYFTLDTTVDEDGRRKPIHVEGRSELLPVLIPEGLWDQVALMRQRRRPEQREEALRFRASPNLLGGIVRCGSCGSVMRPRIMTQRRTRIDGTVGVYHLRYYMCQRGQMIGGCDYRGQINLDMLDEVVLQTVNETLRKGTYEDLLQRCREQRSGAVATMQSRLKHFNNELNRIQSTIDRNQGWLESANDAGEIEHYRSHIRSLIAERNQLQSQAAQVEDEMDQSQSASADEERAIRLALEWPDRWDRAPAEQKRRMLLDILDRVTFHHKERTVDIIFRFTVHGSADGTDHQTLAVHAVPLPKRKRRQ